jgi:type I restriction enzyme S subunit
VREGWKTTRLGDVCTFENGDRGKNYPGRKAFVPTGIPFINAGHLDKGEINWQSMDYIPRERFELLGNGKVRKDDLLFCLRGSESLLLSKKIQKVLSLPHW